MPNADTIRALCAALQHEAARELATRLASESPSDADVQFECARVHDFLGRERAAVPYYVRAIAAGLPDESLRRAYVGLGSTYRALGEYESSERTLREGLARFPAARELATFLAMTLYNLGRSKEAVELLLTLLGETADNDHIQSYRRAILFYARDVEAVWRE